MLFILCGMVLLLVGLKHYLNRTMRQNEMNDADNARFRKQIENDQGVMSQFNLFRRFLSEEETPSVPRFFQGEGKKRPKDHKVSFIQQHTYKRK